MEIKISDLSIEVEQKAIKHMHLAVYPPDGRVHLSMPDYLSIEDARAFVWSRITWIRKQQKEVLTHERQPERQYISGEGHYLFGKLYELIVVREEAAPRCEVSDEQITLYVRPEAELESRKQVMKEWYRQQLKEYLTSAVARWCSLLGVTDASWEVRQMTSKWGSCVTRKQHILFNLELARVPKLCIDYVILHELVHLQVHNHNKQFEATMSRYMPQWRERKKELNNFISLPIT